MTYVQVGEGGLSPEYKEKLRQILLKKKEKEKRKKKFLNRDKVKTKKKKKC